MKKITLFLTVVVYVLHTSCTKEIEKIAYLHDTVSIIKPVNLLSSDTVRKHDIASDTVIQTRHDTLIITKHFTDSVKITDTIYVTKSFFGDYNGDSVTLSVREDSGLSVASVEVYDMTSINSSGEYGRSYMGVPSGGSITVPNYPLSSVRVDVKSSLNYGCHVDLAGFQYEHILTANQIHFTNIGFLASFQYVIISGIFTIHAREN